MKQEDPAARLESPAFRRGEESQIWPTAVPVEALIVGDAYIAAHAELYDSIIAGLGDALRCAWEAIRPKPLCDCPMDPYHRWNCALTPIWAQTIRDLDTNPWTVIKPWDLVS